MELDDVLYVAQEEESGAWCATADVPVIITCQGKGETRAAAIAALRKSVDAFREWLKAVEDAYTQ